jgi:ubiquinone/menaquinone biosynthesis C-methylase UbiE
MESDSVKVHSEEYFGEYRDFWWNSDHIELLARRWQLSSASTLLDVGCGLCHWSCLLTPHLKRPSWIFAVDKDQKWSSGSHELLKRFNELGASVEFRHGDAQALPFPDDSFDVVTCQTVLIHCSDPKAALLEMKRVAKPGGVVICAEPNNLIGTASFDSIDHTADVDTLVDKFRERLLFERGRRAAGEGNISLGDQLSSLFSRTGFGDIQSYLSDRLNPLYPPYDRPEQKADISQIRNSTTPERRRAEHEQNLRYTAALNDAESLAFTERRRTQSVQESRAFFSAIDDGTFYSSGMNAMIVVSGRK